MNSSFALGGLQPASRIGPPANVDALAHAHVYSGPVTLLSLLFSLTLGALSLSLSSVSSAAGRRHGRAAPRSTGGSRGRGLLGPSYLRWRPRAFFDSWPALSSLSRSLHSRTSVCLRAGTLLPRASAAALPADPAGPSSRLGDAAQRPRSRNSLVDSAAHGPSPGKSTQNSSKAASYSTRTAKTLHGRHLIPRATSASSASLAHLRLFSAFL